MNDFQTLTDAFDELERRADVATLRLPADPIQPKQAHHRSRPLLVAASAVTVLAVVGGGALLARGDNSHHVQPGGNDSPATANAALTSDSSSSSTSAAPAAFRIPTTPDELASMFRNVLGDTATFTVTDPAAPHAGGVPSMTPTNGNQPVQSKAAQPTSGQSGAAIVGTLTASGVTGGFDLQIFKASPGEKAMCDDPDRSHCTITALPDASGSLAFGSEPLEGAANGVTYEVNLIRTDGVEFLMHVSNERDPKGDSPVLAAHPPLTTDQMIGIVASRW